MEVQCPPVLEISPDVPVDGFMADREFAAAAQGAGDLLPVKTLIAPAAAAPRARAFLRLMHPVTPVVPRTVAPQLPPKGAPVPAQTPADLNQAHSFHPPRRKQAALFQT